VVSCFVNSYWGGIIETCFRKNSQSYREVVYGVVVCLIGVDYWDGMDDGTCFVSVVYCFYAIECCLFLYDWKVPVR